DEIRDLEPAVDFLHHVAAAVDGLEDVGPFLVRSDLVGELAPAPVVGLLDGSAKALGDLLDLRVQVGDLGVGRLGRHDVDEFVLPFHVSPSGLSGRHVNTTKVAGATSTKPTKNEESNRLRALRAGQRPSWLSK